MSNDKICKYKRYRLTFSRPNLYLYMYISLVFLQLENDLREMETSFFTASFYSETVITSDKNHR